MKIKYKIQHRRVDINGRQMRLSDLQNDAIKLLYINNIPIPDICKFFNIKPPALYLKFSEFKKQGVVRNHVETLVEILEKNNYLEKK